MIRSLLDSRLAVHNAVIVLAAMMAVAVSAGEAGAQHCWPTMVSLVVRDSAGEVLDPREVIKDVSYAPLPGGDAGHFKVQPWTLRPGETAGLGGSGSLPVLLWAGQGDCRVDMREVVIRRHGREMRLLLDVHLDSDREPRFGEYLIDLVPFAPGTWRLDVSPLPTERPENGPIFIPARHWRRVEEPTR